MNTPVAFISNLGVPEIFVTLAIALFVVWPFWRIFKKLGYPDTLGLLMIVPFVNLVLILFLAFAQWPTQKSGK